MQDNDGNTPIHKLLQWNPDDNNNHNNNGNHNGNNSNLSQFTSDNLKIIRGYQYESLNLLLQADSVDLSLSNNDGEQPLHIATRLGLLNCMQALLKSPVKINSHSNLLKLGNSQKTTTN